MPLSTRIYPLSVLVLTALASTWATNAHAQWTGAAGNNIYNDSANWTDGIINGNFTTTAPGANLLFNADITTGINFQIDTIAGGTTLSGSGGTRTINLNGDLKASGTSVDTTITIANSLILNLNGANSSTVRTFGNTSTTGAWNIDALVTGTGALNLGGGTGSVNLNNTANDFTGNVTFSRRGGSFASIADSGVASALGAGSTITVADVTSGGSLDYKGGDASSNRTWNWTLSGGSFAFNQNGSGTLTLTGNWNDTHANAVTFSINANSGDLVLNGVINGNNSLIFGGAKTKTLNGLNTFSGNVSVSAGVLEFNTVANAGTASALGQGTTINLGSGGAAATLRYTGTDAGGHSTGRTLNLTGTAGSVVTVEANGAGALKFTSPFTATGTGAKTLTLGGSSAASVLNEISGAVVDGSGTTSLTKSGANTWVLSGTNTYTGTTTINGGTLALSGANGAAASSSGFTVNSGGMLLLTNTAAGNKANRIGDTVAITLNTGTFNFSNTDIGASYSENVGTLTLTGGINTVTASQVDVGQTSSLSFTSLSRSGGGSVDFTGTGLGVNDRNRILFTTTAPPLTNGIIGAWATYGGVDFASYDGTNGVKALTGYADITRLTPGTISNGATTNVRLVEGTTGSAGNIALGSATTTINSLNQSASGGASAATIDLAGNTLQTNGILVGSGAGSLTIGTGTGTNVGILKTASSANGELVLNNQSTNTLTINSAIADNTSASALVKTGSGTVILSGANTYTGSTTINAGTLKLGVANTFAATTVAYGATLDLGGFSNSIASLAGAGIVTNSVALTVGGGSTSTTFSGVIQDGASALALTKTGTGTQTLSGANTYTGSTTISGGILSTGNLAAGGQASGIGASSNAASNLVLDGGTLQYTGATVSTDRSLTISAGQTSTIEVSTSAANLTISGSVVGSTGALTKAGPGILTLSGTTSNTYTGLTTLNNGYLVLSKPAGTVSIAGDITINTVNASTLWFTADNQLGGNGTLTFTGASNNSRFDLIATKQSLAGIVDATSRGVVQNSEANFPAGVPTSTGTGTLTLTGSGTYAFNGYLRGQTGVLALNKTGSGTQTLSGANIAYTGATTVSGGTLVFANSNTLGTSITVSNGGIVRFDRSDAFGVHTSAPTATVTIGQGGVLTNGGNYLNTLNNPTLSGGELRTTGGNATYGAWQLKGIVTVNGTAASTIAAPSSGTNTFISLGNNTAGGTTTFNVADVTGDASADLTVANVLANGVNSGGTAVASGFAKAGAGMMLLTGGNTYTGPTIVGDGTLAVSGSISGSSQVTVQNSGSLLLKGTSADLISAVDRIGNATPVTLNGATLQLDNSVGKISETVGALTLTSNSVIDLGDSANGSVFRFADSSNQVNSPWAAGATLSIWNWSGNAQGTGIDQLFFGNGSTTGLNSNQLGSIIFYSDAGQTLAGQGAMFIGGGAGQIAPVPEPSTIASGLAMLGYVFFHRRRTGRWSAMDRRNDS